MKSQSEIEDDRANLAIDDFEHGLTDSPAVDAVQARDFRPTERSVMTSERLEEVSRIMEDLFVEVTHAVSRQDPRSRDFERLVRLEHALEITFGSAKEAALNWVGG